MMIDRALFVHLVSDIGKFFAKKSELPKKLSDLENDVITDRVQADWEQTDDGQPDYVKNKPRINGVELQGDKTDAQLKICPISNLELQELLDNFID